ncbi:MAG: hypothetical protein AABX55_01165 [Nanoarchaeota archaeon]
MEKQNHHYVAWMLDYRIEFKDNKYHIVGKYYYIDPIKNDIISDEMPLFNGDFDTKKGLLLSLIEQFAQKNIMLAKVSLDKLLDDTECKYEDLNMKKENLFKNYSQAIGEYYKGV